MSEAFCKVIQLTSRQKKLRSSILLTYVAVGDDCVLIDHAL